MMLDRYRNLACVVMSACVMVLAAGCGGSEKATVAIEYVLNPSVGLPAGMASVAILDAKVNQVTDTKWSEMAANYLQELIQEANHKYGSSLQVADRKHTGSVMKEQDMAAAGMVDSPNPGALVKQLGIQGMIMAEINVKVETHKGKGRTISGLSAAAFGGHGWGGGGGSVDTEEAETVSRNITVQTDFKLVDAANQKNWVTHSPKPYRRSDKTKISPFFGSSKTEASLTPRDEIIGAAVEVGARGFISKIIPCAVRYEVSLKSSGQENCVQGVKFLRGEMYAEALSQFQMALAEDPDDHRAAYAAGVCCEASGDYAQALSFYKRALTAKNKTEYVVAKKRMDENMDRIRTAG
ncbi:MAG: tetratricopeptide repeat protein [bacterium]|nr:tetratricopeptide repeat protein [bacterium]